MSRAPLESRPPCDETPVRSILAAWTIAAALLSVGVLFVSFHHRDANAGSSMEAGHSQQAAKPPQHADEDEVAW